MHCCQSMHTHFIHKLQDSCRKEGIGFSSEELGLLVIFLISWTDRFDVRSWWNNFTRKAERNVIDLPYMWTPIRENLSRTKVLSCSVKFQFTIYTRVALAFVFPSELLSPVVTTPCMDKLLLHLPKCISATKTEYSGILSFGELPLHIVPSGYS